MEVLRLRGLNPDAAALARIASTEDPALLLRWLDRAVTATTLDEVLADG